MRGFARVSRREDGYDPEQVDDFFTRARDVDGGIDETAVRQAAFDLVPAGYDPEQVDLALDRLEESHTRRRRQQTVAEGGDESWRNHLDGLTESLLPRLGRPERERFVRARTTGYAAPAVDAFLGRVEDYLETGEGLRAEDVRSVTFPPAQGKKAYDEAVVDVYLDRVVEVVLARA
ncbi:DivIVA domain-containing protein [Georgenia sp. Z1491]|uniref:DivIVA domain-containing protein n=1 Tax=Georgenia sp. Z1491 TaxID=3416707 RepID=UPI003CF426C5